MPSTKVKRGVYWSERTKTWHYEVRINGKKRNGDTGHTLQSLALDYVADLRRAANREKDGLPPEVQIPTLRKALEAWKMAETGSLTEKHVTDRVYTLSRHLEEVLDLPLDKLDTSRLDAIRADYLAGVWRTPNWHPKTSRPRTPGGWNHVRRHLVGLVNWCYTRGLLATLPFRSKPLKVQEKAAPIIWPEKVSTFLTHLESTTTSQHMRTAIRLQLQLGLREDEALDARWECLDARTGVYRPSRTKDREVREIALPPGLLAYLRLHHGKATHGLILPAEPTEKGQAPEPHRAGYTAKAVARAGMLMKPKIHGLHPHALRATFATAHWEAGTPLSLITAMLGHEDPQTTMGYIRQRARDAKKAQTKVAESMGLAPSPPRVPRKPKHPKAKPIKSRVKKK